ncbi:UPF0183-domain-containing protein [Macrolepiota fuliginosa MF-IS2]|uniref:UPF0183-domain-containing protein n=1 Tax=Macrolepiota fuliginosa MF-IS2 TaxID=1400762 RepID=A0A9P5X8T7_9AGAR|nr:UPF0183-domain-containing protein [Macrolepiota fuliginosa MF-IS2]
MYSTLEFDIRPGSGIGLFEIGASLWTILDTLRRLQTHFPQIDIKYDPDTSTLTPLIVQLRPHIDLLFSGTHQRLHTITIHKLQDSSPPLILKYKDIVLSSPEEVLRRVGVSRTFGPTYPTGSDDLRYPGLWFSFEEDVRPIDVGVGKGAHVTGLKGKQAEDRLQEVKKIMISQKGNDGKAQDALDEVAECPAMHGDIERAIIKLHDGIRLYFYPTGTKPLHIRLNETTAQDLTLDLGPPLRVHYKEDERMTIHSTDKGEEGDGESDYFYNYFQHGLDFFISGGTHTIKKIIVHTNIPGSPLFQRYKRCNWEIEGEPEDDEDDTPPRKRFYDRFETISHFLSPKEPPPSMHLNRTDDEDGLQLPNPTTRLYGYDGIILEVLESSQVVSITLF